MSALERLLSSFGYREYRRYWTGSSLTIITIRIQEVVLGWQILEMTDSAFWLGLVAFAYGLPLLILSPVTGLVADRFRRQRVVLVATGLAAVVSTLLALLTLAGVATPPAIMLTSFVIGCGFTLFAPARLALLPNLIPDTQLLNAASMEYASTRLMGFLGPMAAGFLLAAVGIGPALLVQAVLFAAAGLVFSRTGTEVGRPVGGNQDGIWQGLRQAFAFLRSAPPLLALVTLGLFTVSIGMAYTRLTQVFVRSVLGAGPEILGIALALAGLGAAFSGLVITMLSNIRRRGRAVLLSSAAFGAGLIALALSRQAAAALLLLFGLGLASGVFLTISQVTLQVEAPDRLRGRLLSIWGMVWGLVPITSLVAGSLADIWGVPAVFVGGGLVALAGCAVMVLGPGNLLKL